jgi:hypothetical protein
MRAIDLLRQGRHQDSWQMCCGYLKLDIEQFMALQKRLLLEQIEILSRSTIGRKIMAGAWPQTVDDFRKEVPLTNYSDYCPELHEKREDTLPEKPAQWVHTSGRTGEYTRKWVPMSQRFVQELGPILYGIGLISGSREWGDIRPFTECPKMIYTVAPRPYVSGALANILQEQTPSHYLPSLADAESLPFEERIKLGFGEALSEGLDYFFGLSLVLATIGEKFSDSSRNINVSHFLSHPKALMRLTRGIIKSRLARRALLPKDIWKVKGIICSGLDSSVYKEKIKEYWGRYPLDIYANTEGGVIATQTWDYSGMSFIPNLNFLEFIPEKEHFKWQLDHRYQPKTVLLDEVKSGEYYEIVITNFHGGVMTRYRIGDMIRITSLRNDNLGINIPQMAFERRADDLIDFATIRLSEKTIWNAIEDVGLPYEDWVAYKDPQDLKLHLLVEPKPGYQINEREIARQVFRNIMKQETEGAYTLRRNRDAFNQSQLEIKLTALPQGTFARYISYRKAEGADIAHLKPPHVNPPQKVLSMLLPTPQTIPESADRITILESSIPMR